MEYFSKYIGGLFFSRNFYFGIAAGSGLFLTAYFVPFFQAVAFYYFLFFIITLLLDYFLLFLSFKNFHVERILPARLSNGDKNEICWIVRNDFNFPVRASLIDEWPSQLEIRDQKWKISLAARQQKKIRWKLRPVRRGVYEFGDVHLFVRTPLGLVSRKFTTEAAASVPCYPSFIHIRQYSIRSNATIPFQTGNLRMRRIGQSMEFEQIKEYITGDDIRTLNWKASARRASLMVNQFVQERAQQVYCIIDKGRLMKMPFNDMTLLDYAVNASLVLSSVCLDNRDRTGLITFSDKIDTVIAADNRPLQMGTIMDALYKQETDFLESDFEGLYHTIRARIKNRSLLILFTNFESVSGLHRQLDFIRSLARYHLVLVIFFENTELKSLIKKPAKNIEQVYIKTIAGKFAFEKKQIAADLSKYGIATIMAKPNQLTVKTINKYLELKAKTAI